MITKLASALALGLFLTASAHAADAISEKDFQKLMKEVGDAAKRFKSSVEGKNAEQLGKDAALVNANYTKMAAFWKARKVEDAEKWSHESATAAGTLAASAKAANWDKAKQDAQGVMKNCKSCHDAHRVKLDDGSYQIK
jgi:cytochrome c556